MFVTGLGSSAGLSSSMNAVAKSFPDKTRASATGSVLAGFGLSAFAFTTLSHNVFNGDGGQMLKLLAFGTGVPIFIGSFVIRVVPPEVSEAVYEPVADEEALIREAEVFEYTSQDNLVRPRSTSLELSRSRSPGARRGRPLHAHFPEYEENGIAGSSSPLGTHPANKYSRASSVASVASISPLAITFTPFDLVGNVDFWIIFLTLSLLCGIGLMYINNAGTVALALGRAGKLIYDKKAVSSWQSQQVATVSVWNCLGRIFGGVGSDYCKNRFKLQRVGVHTMRPPCHGVLIPGLVPTPHCLRLHRVADCSIGCAQCQTPLDGFVLAGCIVWSALQHHAHARLGMVRNG